MLTTENRTKLAKILKERLEDARISVRKIRQEEMDTTTDLPEDEMKRAKDDIQKCVDEANKNLEAIFAKKESDVMN
jgi:ribosome recycling factor